MISNACTQVVALIRHGEAKSTIEDPDRPLTVVGSRHAEVMASWLGATGLHFEEVRHSPKTRAAQTARIIARRLELNGGRVRQATGVAPGDAPEPEALHLESDRRSVVLVSHLPFLNLLASRLLCGREATIEVRWPDAGALLVCRQHGGWQLLGMMTHELLG